MEGLIKMGAELTREELTTPHEIIRRKDMSVIVRLMQDAMRRGPQSVDKVLQSLIDNFDLHPEVIHINYYPTELGKVYFDVDINIPDAPFL
jgi:hypothetical protein